MQGPIFESMMHKIDYVTDEDINVSTSTESWSSGEDGLDQELDDIDYPRGSSNGRFDLFQDMGLSVMDNFMPSGNTGSNNELRACFSISTPCDSKMNGAQLTLTCGWDRYPEAGWGRLSEKIPTEHPLSWCQARWWWRRAGVD